MLNILDKFSMDVAMLSSKRMLRLSGLSQMRWPRPWLSFWWFGSPIR